ncbi:MAG: L,D-transpeptidase family protein [Calditrichota bacterium]
MRLFPGLLLLIAAIVLTGCQTPPQKSLEIAESALASADNTRARQYAAPLYREAEYLLDAGRMEMARQKGRLSFLRDFAAADSMLRRSTSKAQMAERISTDSLRTLEETAKTHVSSLEAEINRWREVLNGTLILFKAETQWSYAEMGLQQAKHLLEAGEFAEAIRQVVQTRDTLNRLNRVFLEYVDDEADNNGHWQRWVNATLDESRSNDSYAIIVDKNAHKTYLIKSGHIAKTYPCDVGYNSAAQKTYAGDGATPEGRYHITSVKNESKYYRALLINYPNDADQRRFSENKRKGLISKRAGIGRLIEIHGHGGQNRDWTDGCVALADNDMDDLMEYVGVNTPVTIVRRWKNAPTR